MIKIVTCGGSPSQVNGGGRLRPRLRGEPVSSAGVGLRGFKSHPPHHAHLINQNHDFLKFIKLKDISDKEKKDMLPLLRIF